MGTVKYTGPVASFHCPTNAEIRSLKVHFSPKQEGSGDPSPENVREIVGWEGVSTYHKGKNLLNISDDNIIYENYSWSNNGSYYSINDTTITLYNTEAKSFMVCFSALEITEKLVGKQIILSAITTGLGDYGIFRSNLDGTNRSSSLANPYTIVNSDIGCLLGVRIRINGYTGLYTVNNIQLELGSTPTPYEPYRGGITNYEFGVLGKNKFNGTLINKNIGSTGKILSADLSRLSSFYVPVSSGTYTLSSAENYPAAIYVYKENNDDSFIANESLITWNESPVTFTINEGKYISIKWKKEDSSSITTSDISNIQLELGSTATTYEPYDPNKIVYGGWVDLITGEVCEEWRYAILNDPNKFASSTDTTDFLYSENFSDRKRYSTSFEGLICNSFPVSYFASSAYMRWNGAGTYKIGIKNKNTSYTLSDIQQMASNENITVCYELATPITYHIAPTELQTFLGQNNVWSNADYVEVEYDLHETQDILTRKQFIIANQPHLEEVSGSITTFNTDMSAPLKECKVEFKPVQNLNGEENPYPPGGGVNIWDEEWEAGNINSYTGVNNSNSGIRSKNYIPCLPDTTYYIYPTATDNSEIKIIQYDVNKDYIKYSWHKKTSRLITVSNAQYLRFSTLADYGSTYNNDISINYPSTDTSYHPYSNICPIEGWNELNINSLPLEYQQVEYIQTNYTSSSSTTTGGYINIGIKPYLGLCSELVVKLRSGGYPLGSGGGNNADYYGWNCAISSSGRIAPYLGTGKYPTEINGYPLNDFRTLKIEGKKAYVDNQLIYDYANSTNTFNFENARELTLGAFHGSPIIMTPIILKSAKFWDEATGNWLGYFIPCYRKSDNEVGLYDIVANTFFEHSGNKEFIAGSNVTEHYSTNLSWSSTVGTIYGGYIDLVKGELVAEYEMLSDTWGNWGTVTDQGDGTELRYKKFTNPVYGDRQGNNISYCNVAKYHYTNNNGKVHFYISSSSYNCRVYLPSGTDTNLQIQAVGKLVTPIHYLLTPTQLKTLRGTNNIWSNAGDVSVSYWTH